MRRLWWWALMGATVACDDGETAQPTPADAMIVDAMVIDAAPGSDASTVDAAPASDAMVDAMANADADLADADLADAVVVDAAIDGAVDAMAADGSAVDAVAPDAAVDAMMPDAVAPDMAMPDAAVAVECGAERLPTAQIRGTEGLAIAADGTAYYSQSRAVGRRAPNGAPTNRWVDLPAAGTVWGLAMRDEDNMLFVASPSDGGVIYRIDTTQAPAEAQVWHRNAGSPNGLIIGPDGTPYFSDFGGGHVYRVDGRNQVTRITTSPVPSANGLLFDDDGTLLVLAYREGRVYRLTLNAQGIEQGRVRAHAVNGAALDGIAKDADGRIYLSDNGNGRLLRFDADFGNAETLLRNVGAAANIVFGRGALDCDVAYVASSGTLGSIAID